MAPFRYHKSLPMACIYFFLNTFDFFPTGLLVTSMLSPFFYIWLLRKRKRFVIEPFFIFLAPFAIASYFNGNIVLKDYIVSTLMDLTAYMTVYAFAVKLVEIRDLDRLLRTIIWINFAEACVGLVVRFTSFERYMWQDNTMNGAAGQIRYRAFTHEAAFYALLITPLVLYSYWKFVQRKNWANLRLLVATGIPFLMTLSIGNSVSLASGILVSQVVLHRHLRQTKWFVVVAILGIAGFIALPSTSHVKMRVYKILNGSDNSANAHLTEGYVGAYAIAKKTNIWFGAGIGQTKLYIPSVDTWGKTDISLNCAVSETFATLGIVGLALRLGLEGIFFFRCRPWKDPYRLSVFVFIFVLQFGYGYLNDPVEYIAFIISFSSLNLFQMPVPVRRKRLALRAVPQPA
jgi:hypothetical protein